MDYEALKLDNQLCFPLYAAAKEVVRLYAPLLGELKLTYTQYITLLALWEHAPLSVKELGEKLYLDSGTLTPLLKKMEAAGLVRRARSQADERSVRVMLTQKGLALREQAAEIPARLAACLPLSAVEAETLDALLRKVLGGISDKPFARRARV